MNHLRWSGVAILAALCCGSQLWADPPKVPPPIEVTPGDEIVLDTVDAQKPAVIRASEAQEFLYLLMPVRVS